MHDTHEIKNTKQPGQAGTTVGGPRQTKGCTTDGEAPVGRGAGARRVHQAAGCVSVGNTPAPAIDLGRAVVGCSRPPDNGKGTPVPPITRQEVAAINAVARYGTIPRAAEALDRAPCTVDTHLDRLRRKTGLHYLPQLVAWAALNGLLSVSWEEMEIERSRDPWNPVASDEKGANRQKKVRKIARSGD